MSFRGKCSKMATHCAHKGKCGMLVPILHNVEQSIFDALTRTAGLATPSMRAAAWRLAASPACTTAAGPPMPRAPSASAAPQTASALSTAPAHHGCAACEHTAGMQLHSGERATTPMRAQGCSSMCVHICACVFMCMCVCAFWTCRSCRCPLQRPGGCKHGWGVGPGHMAVPAWISDVPAWIGDAPAWIGNAPAWIGNAPAWISDVPAWIGDAPV